MKTTKLSGHKRLSSSKDYQITEYRLTIMMWLDYKKKHVEDSLGLIIKCKPDWLTEAEAIQFIEAVKKVKNNPELYEIRGNTFYNLEEW